MAKVRIGYIGVGLMGHRSHGTLDAAGQPSSAPLAQEGQAQERCAQLR